jgi:Uma2 family endonuclease
MTLAPPAPHPDALAPLRLPADLRLTPEQRRGFPPLCPDLLVELASPSAIKGPPSSMVESDSLG